MRTCTRKARKTTLQGASLLIGRLVRAHGTGKSYYASPNRSPRRARPPAPSPRAIDRRDASCGATPPAHFVGTRLGSPSRVQATFDRRAAMEASAGSFRACGPSCASIDGGTATPPDQSEFPPASRVCPPGGPRTTPSSSPWSRKGPAQHWRRPPVRTGTKQTASFARSSALSMPRLRSGAQRVVAVAHAQARTRAEFYGAQYLSRVRTNDISTAKSGLPRHSDRRIVRAG
jgi:hypothetical protein